jgi:hypothetical protein
MIECRLFLVQTDYDDRVDATLEEATEKIQRA